MPNEAHLITWLEHLWQLYPAQSVLIVGAGNGSSPWIDALQRWSAPSVILVEADDAQFQHLQRNLPAREGWHLRKQVVAAESGSVSYHQASNLAESGLIEPENLRALWSNLKTRQKSTRQAISLAELLALTEPQANWLLLDCLPAGALLAGSGDALATCDVIVTRALLPEAGADLPSAQADANTITQLLQTQGFCTVAMQTSRHPSVAHMLHVRDHAAQRVQLNVALAQAEQATQKCTAEARQQVDDLTSELAQVRKALQQAQQTSQQAALAQVTATQTLKERDAQLKALQTELAKSKEPGALARATDVQAKSQAVACAKNLQLEASQSLKDQDADIDDFMDDLAILFRGMSLNYVDIGAFTGQVYKKLLDSKKVSIREAHLYEPNPDSYSELKKVLISGHAHAYQLAVSDKSGNVNLIPARSMTKIVPDHYSGLGDIFSVACVTLDSQVDIFTDRKINLLKIDVEGSELNVLNGANKLLSNQSIDVIYIEVGFNLEGTQQSYFPRIDEFLQKTGYRVFKIYEQKNEWISDSPLLRRCNFSYLSKKFAASRPLSLLKQIAQK